MSLKTTDNNDDELSPDTAIACIYSLNFELQLHLFYITT